MRAINESICAEVVRAMLCGSPVAVRVVRVRPTLLLCYAAVALYRTAALSRTIRHGAHIYRVQHSTVQHMQVDST